MTERTDSAVSAAETADFEGVPFRVVGADYLAVIALSVGRAENMARVCRARTRVHERRQPRTCLRMPRRKRSTRSGLAAMWLAGS
jgi:hypothetical protein